ncbi:MAG TPA: hypothetical protein DCF68_03655 [Cyanothece sp. UBA12306]|nr:hypothetical protein [Cyanothece sp. UBA12306]
MPDHNKQILDKNGKPLKLRRKILSVQDLKVLFTEFKSLDIKVSFSDVISIVSSVIALFAVFISLQANFVAKQVATSDFQAVEQVKSETAQLISVLRALMIKGIVYSQQDKSKRDNPKYERFVDTTPERDQIEAFMHSPTALAYYSYIAKRSKNAREARVKREEWRAFFLQLAELRQISNPWLAARAAAKLEKLFDDLGDQQIKEIASNLNDLPRAISILFAEREHDVLVQVMVNPEDEPINDDNFIDFVKFLRENKEIDDPDLDIFWAASSRDADLAQTALSRGARVNIRSHEIIERYKSYVSEFEQVQDTE